MPKNRTSHVKRCFGVTRNSSGGFDVDEDAWLDIMRTDSFWHNLRDGGQDYKFILEWKDTEYAEMDAPDPEGRITKLGKGRDPELPFEADPSDFVPYRVIYKLIIQDSDQKVVYTFLNDNATPSGDPISTTRSIDTTRLYHSDTTCDDQLNVSGGQNTVDADSYQLVGDPDKSQYADMEVIRHWTHSLRADGQKIETVLKNAEVYEALGISIQDSLSPGTNSSGGGPVIPARLDPFQNIVNVQWGGIAVEFGDKDRDAPDQVKP